MTAVWFLLALLARQSDPVELPDRFVGFYAQDLQMCARKMRVGMSLSRREMGNGIMSVAVVGARPLGPNQLEVTTHENGVVGNNISIITLRDDGGAVVFDASAAEKYKDLPKGSWEFTFVKCPA